MPVSIRDVVEAIDLPNNDWRSYLNVDTGELVTVTGEDRRLVENGDDPDELPKVREALESDRFLELPGSFEIHEWSIMEDFAAGLANERSTINRLGIEKDWYRYRDSALERVARDWLEANNIPYR